MPTHHQDGIGLLVIRAYTAEARPPSILIRVLEVHKSHADRVIGTAATPNEAGEIVASWLRTFLVIGRGNALDGGTDELA